MVLDWVLWTSLHTTSPNFSLFYSQMWQRKIIRTNSLKYQWSEVSPGPSTEESALLPKSNSCSLLSCNLIFLLGMLLYILLNKVSFHEGCFKQSAVGTVLFRLDRNNDSNNTIILFIFLSHIHLCLILLCFLSPTINLWDGVSF